MYVERELCVQQQQTTATAAAIEQMRQPGQPLKIKTQNTKHGHGLNISDMYEDRGKPPPNEKPHSTAN